MGKREIKFEDNRKKEIIFLSSCILNQNNRFPGIAVHKGAINNLIEPFLKEGIGIEQLPCLECMGWGGVSRKNIFRFLPSIFRHSNSKLMKLSSKIWISKYQRLCKKEAKRIVKRIENYILNGYKIIGIIGMNDSPTCGVTNTINLLNSIFHYREFKIELKDFQSPNIEKMKKIIPKMLIEGQGIFMKELISKIRKKKSDILIIGFDPWLDIEKEAKRIKDLFFKHGMKI